MMAEGRQQGQPKEVVAGSLPSESSGVGSPTSWQFRGWGLGWGGCGVNSVILAPLLEVRYSRPLVSV